MAKAEALGFGGVQRGDAGRRRAAEAGVERDAFGQAEGKAGVRGEALAQRHQRTPSGIAFGFQRQVQGPGDIACDGIDADDGFGNLVHCGEIARAVDGVAQEVKPDPDIADTGGGEGGDGGR